MSARQVAPSMSGMNSSHISADLMADRQQSLLAWADTERRSREARDARRRESALHHRSRTRRLVDRLSVRVAPQKQRIVLRDGSAIVVRPVRRSDPSLLAGLFDRLSAQSRQRRYLTAKAELTTAELRYLTDVDHHGHEALVALSRDGRAVGVARFVRSPAQPNSAEVAITIVDEWQSRELGTELVTRLVERAREEGVHRFVALISKENQAA